MVLVDPSLVRPVKVHIVDPQFREGVQTLLVMLNGILVPVVVLFVRSLGTRQRISPDVLLLLPSTSHSARGSAKGTKGEVEGARGGAHNGSQTSGDHK
ncbi:hypothetical protein H5410_046944 [Solanum commersonii]|uniref:Uncharacterized protein n=1 Tax=Solanum commersonii TaxID=4109 RepID=A0A9J5XH80_SOLCO|nr:hypothetical protein H5410_046944 [Solanum commersonii]